VKEGQGNLTVHYFNGQKKASGEIKNGMKFGHWTEWYDNSQIKENHKYEEWTGYFSDNTQYKFVFLSSWDMTGNQMGKDGTGWHIVLNDAGRITGKSYFNNGVQDSISISYYENGTISRIDKYDNGRWTYRTLYHDNGNKSYEYSRYGYDQHGIVRTWYYNGQLKLEEKYDKGILLEEKGYYQNGGMEFLGKDFKLDTLPEFDSVYKDTLYSIVRFGSYTYWDKKGNKIEK